MDNKTSCKSRLSRHAGFISASHCYNNKTLKPILQTPDYNLLGRGQAEKAAVQGDVQGFTLIELLVVVLIIGVLASIALPWYEMASERSRATKAIVAVKALAEASERYYMANGFYPENSSSAQSLTKINEDLDVTVNGVQDFTITKYHNVYIAAKRANSSRFIYTISKTLANASGSTSEWRKRGLTCNITATFDNGSRSAHLCKQICGTDTLKQVWGSGQYGCEFQY